MKYISTKGKGKKKVSFRQAIQKGLADDGGLYVPEQFPKLDTGFLNNLPGKSLPEIGYEITRHFLEEPKGNELRELLDEVLIFDAPLVEVGKNRYILELFQGPTMAFKDFGARFMSRIFQKLFDTSQKEIVILVATSGDTGSAVARGFLGVDGIKVCLLYPKAKVSHLQEQQISTVGANVTALEVEGTFDDCQKMVKQAFSDEELNRELLLSSANSINIARLIPQTFYYLYALAQLETSARPIFSVPSGNFGNLTAGLWAEEMGMPARGFIAATNANDIVPRYLKTGHFKPAPSKQTISNAMDVGNPSNFDRIEHLFGGSSERVREHIWGASFTDEQTRKMISRIYNAEGYLLDPHTAVGYLAAEAYLETEVQPFGSGSDTPFVILATAHPAKFADVIEPVTGSKVEMPEQLVACLKKDKQSIEMENKYESLKSYLAANYG